MSKPKEPPCPHEVPAGVAFCATCGASQTVEEDDDDFSEVEGDTGDPKVDEAVSHFIKAICDDDIFESVFGDHVQVTATRTGFKIDEYQHD